MEPRNRETIHIAKCIKCNSDLASIKVFATFKIGFYICDQCFQRLDRKPPEQKLTFMNKDYLFSKNADGDISIQIDGINVLLPKHVMRELFND